MTDNADYAKSKPVSRKSRFMNGRAGPGQAYQPTDIEHVANVVTHGLWIIPSLLGMLWMLYLSHTFWQLVSAVIYGLSLIFLFSVSTTFHTLCYTGNSNGLKNIFHIGDRAVIYIFIASSYTPWLTLRDSGTLGNQMLWIVWGFALFGIWYQYTFHEKYKWFETFLYIVVGTSPAVVIIDMKDSTGLMEMAYGGLVYILGVVFFKSDGVIPFAHAIWHCFVFVGATFHYCAVCKYLLGAANAPIESEAAL